MDTEPTQKFLDAIECIAEAARLHVALRQHSTEEAVAGALMWRFDLSKWEAKECHKHALMLLDKMPRK